MRDLEKFKSWLGTEHPVILERYGRNFTISSSNPMHVGVTNFYKISNVEFENLVKIASDWYRLHEA